jgi:hypothetical protein
MPNIAPILVDQVKRLIPDFVHELRTKFSFDTNTKIRFKCKTENNNIVELTVTLGKYANGIYQTIFEDSVYLCTLTQIWKVEALFNVVSNVCELEL